MELSLELSDSEQSDLLTSINIITLEHIEVFVVNFYEYFLRNETLKFLQQSSNETLINMFTAFLNIIHSHLEDSTLFEEHKEILLEKHPKLREMIQFTPIFIDAFLKALKKTLTDKYTNQMASTWHKVITSFVDFLLI